MKTTAAAAFLAIALGDCAFYYKLSGDTICADDCLGEKVGPCPLSIVVATGGLKAGNCSALGYSVADGFNVVKAGPCGNLNFSQFTK